MTLLESLRESLEEIFGEDDEPDEAIRKLYIGKQSGCVAEEYIGDDLGLAIYRKFYAMADAVRSLVSIYASQCSQFPPADEKDLVEIHIEAGYVDMARVTFTCEDQILLLWQCKPWNFCWASVDQMKKWMYRQWKILRQRYMSRREVATDCGEGDWCVFM